ncbi:hypothetical protein BJ322DRAFT_888048 [Thelephora terrestris]|uniref:NAD(P)-binding domain-containing protein n=1 Tax=Thelephora terrestris TaxID=56493 RepID=A0A9P6HEC3_9AGAM|nr:hypothetical protein BJ322DRAFT_888048 [Thelephora terrestris]
MSKLIITGATGTAGFAAYLAALADPSVSNITLLLRREVPSWADLPSNASQKSKTIIINDFSQYPEDVISQIADHDGCVWALGKSIQGLSEEEYMKIHVDFPLAAVEALKKAGVGSTDKLFYFVYVGGEGSDPSQKSMFLWARGKGRAETELAKALDTPTTRLLVARPGYFFPAHTGQRQNQKSGIGRVLDTTLGPLVTSSCMGLPAGTLGGFLVEGAKGSFPNVSLANNTQLKELFNSLQK